MTKEQIQQEAVKQCTEGFILEQQRAFVKGAEYALSSLWVEVSPESLPERMVDLLFINMGIKDMDGKPFTPSIHYGWYDRDFFHSYIDARDNFTATHYILASSLTLPPLK